MGSGINRNVSFLYSATLEPFLGAAEKLKWITMDWLTNHETIYQIRIQYRLILSNKPIKQMNSNFKMTSGYITIYIEITFLKEIANVSYFIIIYTIASLLPIGPKLFIVQDFIAFVAIMQIVAHSSWDKVVGNVVQDVLGPRNCSGISQVVMIVPCDPHQFVSLSLLPA